MGRGGRVCTIFGPGSIIGLIYAPTALPGFSHENLSDIGGLEKRPQRDPNLRRPATVELG